ncbi:acyl-CoA dehydrogenase family protein [Novosphingobium sp.]|uniref:acyl-CoA dehydrogenase family protein n=1 Tax=Novosphingobium sp. TaxID=1874826 RepID=UPI003BAD1AB6
MDFALSDEQVMLEDAARTALTRSADMAAVRSALRAGQRLEAAWQALAQGGLLGILAPEKPGGAGLGWLEAALLAEAVGHGAVPVPVVDQLVATAILAASGASVNALLASAIAGDTSIALAAAEAGGWEPARFAIDLTDRGLTGTKRQVAFAAQADYLLVIGQDFAALAERDPRRVTLSPRVGIDGMIPLFTAQFEASPAQRLTVDKSSLMAAQSGAMVLIAASALGAASAAIERTIGYTTDRRQFGQPLSAFQAVRHDLADQVALLESARSLLWYAATLLDEADASAARVARIAKAHITEAAVTVIRRCVVLHGAIGFSWECDLQIWLKHAMMCWARYGTPHALRSAVAAGDIAAQAA